MATPRAPMHVRLATATDAEALARLVRQYLAETFPGHPGTDADRLRHDVLENASGASVVVAEREEALIGFMSWDLVYDLHWGVSGALVGDLYVEPGSRGTGVALVLTTGLCAHSQRAGARFLRGTSYDRDSPTPVRTIRHRLPFGGMPLLGPGIQAPGGSAWKPREEDPPIPAGEGLELPAVVRPSSRLCAWRPGRVARPLSRVRLPTTPTAVEDPTTRSTRGQAGARTGIRRAADPTRPQREGDRNAR